jgi:hypothetical protein
MCLSFFPPQIALTIEKVRAICGGKKERHISAGHY